MQHRYKVSFYSSDVDTWWGTQRQGNAAGSDPERTEHVAPRKGQGGKSRRKPRKLKKAAFSEPWEPAGETPEEKSLRAKEFRRTDSFF